METKTLKLFEFVRDAEAGRLEPGQVYQLLGSIRIEVIDADTFRLTCGERSSTWQRPG